MASSLVLGGGFGIGEDDDDDDFMVVGRGRHGRRRHKVRVRMPGWAANSSLQGVSRPHESMDFLPLEPLTLGTGVLTGAIISFPQRPIRGERLILSAVDLDDGADQAHQSFVDPAIYAGAVQVGGAQGSTPFSLFSATAFGVRLTFPEMGQGTRLAVYVRVAVNTSTLGIQLSGGLIGRAVR